VSVHRSPARPEYPGNYKEGEVSRTQPRPAPLGPAKSGRQPGHDHSLHVHGPELHEDQHSMGRGTMSAHEIHHGKKSWEPPHGSKMQSKVGLKHKM